MQVLQFHRLVVEGGLLAKVRAWNEDADLSALHRDCSYLAESMAHFTDVVVVHGTGIRKT